MENSWDAQGRAERSVQSTWYVESAYPQGDYATWASTVFGYAAGGYSAFTWSTTHWSGQPMIAPPALNHQQDFVVDARGTIITARDYWPESGNDKSVAVTFHPNGVEASESWTGWFYPYPHEMGEAKLFDDSGTVLQSDNFYLRAGAGEDKSHVVYTYDQGRLIGRHVENSHYPSWDTSLLLSDAVIDETYTYDGAALKAVDSSETDEQCSINADWQSTTCSWSAGPQLHTAYSYDTAGNLTARVVTDAGGNEVSRYTAVSDADGNLLCEKQVQGTSLSFSRYDYSCW